MTLGSALQECNVQLALSWTFGVGFAQLGWLPCVNSNYKWMGISLLFRSCLVYFLLALEWCSALQDIQTLSHLGGSFSLSPASLAYSPPHFEFSLSPKHHDCAHLALHTQSHVGILPWAGLFLPQLNNSFWVWDTRNNFIIWLQHNTFLEVTPPRVPTGEKMLVWNSSWLLHHSRVPLTMLGLY